MLQRILVFPSRHLIWLIPAVLLTGFGTGLAWEIGSAKAAILPLTFLMIYPTMIGVKWRETWSLAYWPVVLAAMALNFLLIPLLAYGMGMLWLRDHPAMIAGLALAALLPTSGMTISWTMVFKGNVPAAIKMTTIGLILGSLVTPWYLLLMVGQFVPINVVQVMTTIGLIVVLPLAAGAGTYGLMMRRINAETFQRRVKPLLPGVSMWAMLAIVFISIAMKAPALAAHPRLLLISLLVLVGFYLANFTISTLVGRWLFSREDAVALIYGTVMRNLSISLGIAMVAFGAEAALIVTLAYVVQIQLAAWYGKLSERVAFFPERPSTSASATTATAVTASR